LQTDAQNEIRQKELTIRIDNTECPRIYLMLHDEITEKLFEALCRVYWATVSDNPIGIRGNSADPGLSDGKRAATMNLSRFSASVQGIAPATLWHNP
jgi:hypothetical protein